MNALDYRTCPLVVDGLSVTLNGVLLQPVPPEPLSWSKVGNDAHGQYCIVSQGISGKIYQLYEPEQRWREVIPGSLGYGGPFTCHIGWLNDIIVQIIGQPSILSVRMDGLGNPVALGIAPSSGGILDVPPSNIPVPDFGQQTVIHSPRYGTLSLTKAVTRGQTTAGEGGYGSGSTIGIVAYDADTDNLWQVFAGDNQSIPPRLSDDRNVVAQSLVGFLPR